MKTFLQYIYLEMKKMLLSLPGICIGSLLMLTLITGFLFVCHASSETTQKREPVTIGVVANEDEPFVDWIITTVSSIEKTKDTFCFKRLSENEANTKLKKGNISIILIIPQNYIRSIVNGTNKHITIRFAKGQTTIVSFLLRQLSEAASSFILNSEAGIYSMQEYYRIHHLSNAKKDELTLNLQYISEIAKLERGVQIEEVHTNSTYPLTSVYTISAIVLFLFLWGLTCSKMLTSQTRAFQNQLWLNGVKIHMQIFARSIAFFVTCLINFIIITSLASIVMLITKVRLNDTVLVDVGGLWEFALLLLPLLLLSSTFIQLVYEITQDFMGGLLFLFFSVMIMGLFSGCFYPLNFLPETIQHIAKILPVYHGCQYALSILHKSFDATALLLILLDSICFLAITILTRYIRHTR